ncbi:unnamed protein product [Parnassius apollo]|uniref:(apollo) hypothetical protein n=1 Tax=Parnassius apollo TaxID=110799 RepID=A0A8S3X6D8_PARAO|nr:unnamed protein product [Parnassius apollo]
MDADCLQRRREEGSSQREKRWSMNSQRLEEIVAELMKPISDVRRSFDTDLSALLEEYLTEAGLRALEADEGEGSGAEAPNFAELALLLQHSACVYGRKVDYLYQHVLSVSESLHNNTEEGGGAEEPQTPSGGRKRKASVGGCAGGEFTHITLEASRAALRDAGGAGGSRPPPTLPRTFLPLEPRVPGPGDAVLTDYDGEPIGLLADFHVTWRLQNGLLVEDLCQPEYSQEGLVGASVRPPALVELQAAIEAGAPPDPPPRCSTPLQDHCDPPHDGGHCDSPRGEEPPEHDDEPRPIEMLDLTHILDTPSNKRERKRKHERKLENALGQAVKLIISKELRRKLRKTQEFSVAEEWITKVVARRKRRVLSVRRRLRAQQRSHSAEFRGFEIGPADTGGFTGWSADEVAAARALHEAYVARNTHATAATADTTATSRAVDESDDDGFFEQSSLGDSLSDDLASHTECAGQQQQPWSSWSADVLRRAAASERAPDVQATAARLLQHLQCEQQQQQAVPCTRLLAAAQDARDVSRLFLATLFLNEIPTTSTSIQFTEKEQFILSPKPNDNIENKDLSNVSEDFCSDDSVKDPDYVDIDTPCSTKRSLLKNKNREVFKNLLSGVDLNEKQYDNFRNDVFTINQTSSPIPMPIAPCKQNLVAAQAMELVHPAQAMDLVP